MTVQLREKRHFDRSSPVLQYWLANCEGFRIAGAAGGRVEELVAEIDARRPDELVVRGRLGQRRVVPTRAVEAIVPAEKLLILEAAALGRKTAHARRVVDAALVAAEALSLLALRATRAMLVLVQRGTAAVGQAVERSRRRMQERRAAGASPQLVRHRLRTSARAHAAGRRTRNAVTHAGRGLSRRTSYR